MANSAGDKKIGWFIGWFLCALCSVAVYLPVVSVADIFGMSEAERYSLVWYLSQAGFPQVYAVILTVYYAVLAVFGIMGFKKSLAQWPCVLMAVVSVLFFVVNLFWGYIIMTGTGGFEVAVSLTVWSWAYIAVQIAAVIALCLSATRIKEN